MHVIVNNHKLTGLVFMWCLYISYGGVILGKPHPPDLWKITCLSILQKIDDLLGAGKGLLGCWERSLFQDTKT